MSFIPPFVLRSARSARLEGPNDLFHMHRALELAKQAGEQNEVPVGAVLVLDNQIIGEGYNSPISDNNPVAHAEILALQSAAKHIGNYRLVNTTLYVTLEPCMMCTGAIVHARVGRLVYGAKDPKTGVIESVAHFLDQPFLNHQVQYQGGLLAEECGMLLSTFFKEKR